jgi:hypothetical protein
MLRHGGSKALLAAAVVAAGACRSTELLVDSCADAAFIGSDVVPVPGNVLGAVVQVQVHGADSAAVAFGLTGTALDSLAPAVPVSSNIASVPVLGLLPSTEYTLKARAYGRCSSVIGPELRFTTGPLPEDLRSYHASGPDPSPGFVVFNSGSYGIVIDNTGRIVWYHHFPAGAGLNFQVQANGRYVLRPPSPSGGPARWVEIDVLGNVVRSLGCVGDLSPRFHDLLTAADGSYWTMCDEVRVMDLSAAGGLSDARVTGTAIQHVSATGALLFQWSPFDHFAVTDLPPSELSRRDVNWTHGNSLDLDRDGNLIVSFRNLNEVTKIDSRSGAVLWRMGGRANQFTWEETPVPAFSGQHGLRSTGAGELLLLDNLAHPEGSRAERYRYDEATRTVRLLRSYEADAGVIAQVGGTTQNLPGGRALVAFGNGGRLMEFDAEGRVVWRIEGDAGYVFRAQRIRSLYRPGEGIAR